MSGREEMGLPASPSGLRPFGPEPAAQSQAEPLVPNALRASASIPGPKKTLTVWTSAENLPRVDFMAHRCGAFRAEFLRECINVGARIVVDKYCGKDGYQRLSREFADAQAIEARRAATAKTGAVEDESAVGNADAPNPTLNTDSSNTRAGEVGHGPR